MIPEEAEEIVRAAEFDQSPEEGIESLYWQFPGEMWFRYWREHPVEAEARAKLEAGSGT